MQCTGTIWLGDIARSCLCVQLDSLTVYTCIPNAVISLKSWNPSVGASAVIAISGVLLSVTLCTIIIIIIIIVICYRKSKRSQHNNMQMSRITAAHKCHSKWHPPSSLCSSYSREYWSTSSQLHNITATVSLGDQYEMQQYPQYLEYHPEYIQSPIIQNMLPILRCQQVSSTAIERTYVTIMWITTLHCAISRKIIYIIMWHTTLVFSNRYTHILTLYTFPSSMVFMLRHVDNSCVQ